MASRASLSSQPRTHPSLGPANFRPHTRGSTKSDSQAASKSPVKAPSIPIPVRSATPTSQPDPVPVKQTSSVSSPDAHDKLRGVQSEHDAIASQEDKSAVPAQAEGSAAADPQASSSHAEHAVLARLPSAKGHHLVSYASSLPGRPASPMKNPNTPGNLLGSNALSVKTLCMQVICADVCADNLDVHAPLAHKLSKTGHILNTSMLHP